MPDAAICEAIGRLESLEPRITRMEERVNSFGETLHDVVRKLEQIKESLSHIESDAKLAGAVQQQQVHGLTNLDNRFSVWMEKTVALERRLDSLEQSRREELAARAEDEKRKEKIISRYQWAVGVLMPILLALAGYIGAHFRP